MNIEEMKRELIELDNYTVEELEKMNASEIVNAWLALPQTI